MSQYILQRILKSGYLMLLPIMGLAFYSAFIPHQSYPFPVHLDEWSHLTFSEAMLRASSVTVTDPFSGQSTVGLSSNPEAGFHLFWGIFHQISGISWLTIYRYFPGIIFMMTILSAYVLAQRQGFGWQAAFFSCLIPTTVGILGPAFLVPVAMGLAFIALSIFVAFNFTTVRSYLVLFIFISFLLSMHALTAVGLFVILAPYVLLNLRSSFKHSLGIALALALPFLVAFLGVFGTFLVPIVPLLVTPKPLPTYIDTPRIIHIYGYLPIAFALVGIFVLALRGGKRSYGLILGLLALLLMLVTFYTFHYGEAGLYYRSLQYMMLLMGVVAGAGLATVNNLRLPVGLAARLRAPLITENVGNILCIALIGLTLATGIPERQTTPYYHMIDPEDYEAFVWIKGNVDSRYAKALLDPWKATAFAAITEKYVYTRIGEYPKPSDEEANKFLGSGCKDTAFLREHGISIVYTRGECQNADLVEVREYVYLLREVQ